MLRVADAAWDISESDLPWHDLSWHEAPVFGCEQPIQEPISTTQLDVHSGCTLWMNVFSLGGEMDSTSVYTSNHPTAFRACRALDRQIRGK